MDVAEQIGRIRESIAEAIGNLDDLSFAVLREASRGTGVRPAADKTLMQARRALEKADHLLESMAERD